MEVIMGRFNKKYNLIILLIVIFLLTGCNKFRFNTFNASEEEDNNITVTTAPEVNADSSETDDRDEAKKTAVTENDLAPTGAPQPTSDVIQPTENIELPVFTVNVDTSEIETVTALVPADSKITPELIVNKVVEAMADQSIEVGIESVITKDDTVIVSFYKDKAPLSDMGSGYEAAILDAIAQSLIDNLDDYSKVIYRAEGKAYVSGHIKMGVDEVYLGDN